MRTSILTLLVAASLASAAAGQTIFVADSAASPPVLHAANKLAADLGTSWAVVDATPASIVIDTSLALPTSQSYRLSGSGTTTVTVEASAEAGTLNGVHSLRRRLMEAGITGQNWSSFAFSAPVQVTPNFARRGVMVAPYGFGGQQGLETFGADQWGVAEWKEYVDYLRLLNANFLEVFPLRMWSQKHGTFLDKARYDVWKQVLDYCHSVGMEFHYVMLVNQVSSGFWWANQGLALSNGFQGTATSLLTASTLSPNPMVEEQLDTYTTFKDADAFVFMWNDGGAFDPGLIGNPSPGIVTQIQHANAQLTAVGSSARVIFWGWLQEASVNYLAGSPTEFNQSLAMLAGSGIPMEYLTQSNRWWGGTEPIGAALNHQFVVSNFVWFGHVEDPREILPAARIAETANELQNAQNHGASGITGYRLSPATRRLNDYVTLRLADDIPLLPPDGTTLPPPPPPDMVVRAGLASFLARGNVANALAIEGALTTVDTAMTLSGPGTPPWATYNGGGAGTLAIDSARAAVASLTPGNPDLDRWVSLLDFQWHIFDWADSGLEPRDAITGGGTQTYLERLYQYVRGRQLYRGFTTQAMDDREARVRVEQFMRRIKKPYGD